MPDTQGTKQRPSFFVQTKPFSRSGSHKIPIKRPINPHKRTDIGRLPDVAQPAIDQRRGHPEGVRAETFRVNRVPGGLSEQGAARLIHRDFIAPASDQVQIFWRDFLGTKTEGSPAPEG